MEKKLGKKKEMPYEKGFEIKIPSGSDLPERMKKISALTGLSDYELLQKWLVQEESALNASRYYAETIQSNLRQNIAEQLRTLLQEFRGTAKPKAAKEPQETKEAKPEETGEYRQTLLKRIQDMKNEGMSFVKIADQFNQEGVATVSGTGKWYPSSVFHLLTK
ncbi:MAG: recombinase family protein [Synergistaceae bacterium]|nr:recombinase family protein [Synergistaceae bacterium]